MVNKTTTRKGVTRESEEKKSCWRNGEKKVSIAGSDGSYHKFSVASPLSFFFGGVKPFVEVSIIVSVQK